MLIDCVCVCVLRNAYIIYLANFLLAVYGFYRFMKTLYIWGHKSFAKGFSHSTDTLPPSGHHHTQLLWLCALEHKVFFCFDEIQLISDFFCHLWSWLIPKKHYLIQGQEHHFCILWCVIALAITCSYYIFLETGPHYVTLVGLQLTEIPDITFKSILS